MDEIERRTVDLSRDEVTYLDGKVASGEYGSESDVVGAGLAALQAEDARFERWLRTEGAAAYDEMIAHPERAIPIDDVFVELRALNAERLKETR